MTGKKVHTLAASALVCMMIVAASPCIQGDEAEGWRRWMRIDGS